MTSEEYDYKLWVRRFCRDYGLSDVAHKQMLAMFEAHAEWLRKSKDGSGEQKTSRKLAQSAPQYTDKIKEILKEFGEQYAMPLNYMDRNDLPPIDQLPQARRKLYAKATTQLTTLLNKRAIEELKALLDEEEDNGIGFRSAVKSDVIHQRISELEGDIA